MLGEKTPHLHEMMVVLTFSWNTVMGLQIQDDRVPQPLKKLKLNYLTMRIGYSMRRLGGQMLERNRYLMRNCVKVSLGFLEPLTWLRSEERRVGKECRS